MRILNLYAGIGGNRKLWENVEVTAIEYDPEIAAVYKKFFPQDEVIVTDAHKYLLDNYKEFDFIWSSPPCPTHSRMNNLTNVQESKQVKFPDMNLYQEIIFLKHWFKGKWVVENVKSYYDPLIKPQEIANHYFWSNFIIPPVKKIHRNITRSDNLKEKWGFDLTSYNLKSKQRRTMLNNMVYPQHGLHVFNCGVNNIQKTLL